MTPKQTERQKRIKRKAKYRKTEASEEKLRGRDEGKDEPKRLRAFLQQLVHTCQDARPRPANPQTPQNPAFTHKQHPNLINSTLSCNITLIMVKYRNKYSVMVHSKESGRLDLGVGGWVAVDQLKADGGHLRLNLLQLTLVMVQFFKHSETLHQIMAMDANTGRSLLVFGLVVKSMHQLFQCYSKRDANWCVHVIITMSPIIVE